MDSDVAQALKVISAKIEELKTELAQYKQETISHFDVVAENIHADVAGANQDEISLLKQNQQNLQERISKIEKHVGV